MTIHRDSQIDANVPVPATPAHTRLPWTAPRLERLQGGDAAQDGKAYAPQESVLAATGNQLYGPS